MASQVVGIGLAGGRGVRARPLTLKAPGYLRSKAAMAFLGRRLIRWVVMILSDQGIRDFFIVAHGKENRYQTKVLLRYGEEFGVNVRYSPVKYDVLSTGSADSTLRLLDHWEIDRPALVFPTDSIIDFDLAPMVDQHLRSGAAVTIAGMTRAPAEVAEKYGVVLADPDGRVLEFAEKPTLAELRAHFLVDEEEFERLPLLTNAGFYLLDPDLARKAAGEPEVSALRAERFDFGKDFLPWLVGNGYPVFTHRVRKIGDLGNVHDYVDTAVEVLRGGFESVDRLMGSLVDPERHVWVDPESLSLRDEWTGKTLEEKMAGGLVTIGPSVRIGRYCEIGPEVAITDSNLDDDVEVREGVSLSRAMVRDGTIIGPGTTIRSSVVGSMSEIRSTRERPTVLEDYVALGDEVVVGAGAHLAGDVDVYPRLKVPPGMRVPRGATLSSPQDVLDLL